MSSAEMSIVSDNKRSMQSIESNLAVDYEINKKQVMHDMPHMQILDRIMQVPAVESAVKKSQDVYGRIKSISPMMGSTLDAAENVTRRIAVPLAHKLGGPLNAIDHTLMASLDKLENTLPVVRDTPSDIIRRTEQAISTLKTISVKKTNDALATTGGVRALNTLDAATDRAISLLDHYLPAHESEKENKQVALVEQEKPKEGIERAVQAVGKVGRTVTDRLHGKAQRAIPVAICNLGLAGPLESLNEKVQELKKQEMKKSDGDTTSESQ